MARKRKGRPVSGILLLDKPQGLSSNQALQKVRWLFQAAKAGHTGSLDPFATGMLPVCLGEATKVSNFLLDSSKGYSTRVHLGVQTDTGDPEGQVIEQTVVPELDRSDIEEALRAFEGDVEQVPPMYSALKKDGKRLYELARAGQEVERSARPIKIFDLTLTDFGENWLDLDVVCSKGTYIRVLAEDIGRALGTVAHAETLRRTAVGPFGGGQMYAIEQLEAIRDSAEPESLDRLLIPTDAALSDLPAIHVNETQLAPVRNGNPVQLPPEQYRGLVRIYADRHEFLGIGELTSSSELRPKRLIASSIQ